MRARVLALLAFALAVSLAPAAAVLPDEMLPDPALEGRARALSSQLRCLVCQNQSIDDSDADLARDLRSLVRDRLKAGDTDAAVIAYVADRYGEFVLLKPRWNARNAVLWFAPAALLLAGLAAVATAFRRRSAGERALLSAQESDRLRAILEGSDQNPDADAGRINKVS